MVLEHSSSDTADGARVRSVVEPPHRESYLFECLFGIFGLLLMSDILFAKRLPIIPGVNSVNLATRRNYGGYQGVIDLIGTF